MTRSRGLQATRGSALAWIDALVTQEAGEGCVDEWPFLVTDDGYPRVHIPGVGMVLGSHAVLIRSGRPRPPAPANLALHSCHYPLCLAPWHLRWGTAAENSAEMVASGRSSRGSARHSAKLTEDDVRAIRASTEPHTVLARRLGVRPAAVRDVRSGVTWAHVR